MKITTSLLFIFCLNIFLLCKAQNENRFYLDAYKTLDNMLNDKQKYSFKEGVKYAAENTDVEFNVITENSITVSGTNHSLDSVTPFISNFDNVTLFGHNHPGEKASTIEPSGFNIRVLNSQKNIIESTFGRYQGDRKNADIMPLKVNRFIYAPKYLDGPKTIFYNGSTVISPIRNGFSPK